MFSFLKTENWTENDFISFIEDVLKTKKAGTANTTKHYLIVKYEAKYFKPIQQDFPNLLEKISEIIKNAPLPVTPTSSDVKLIGRQKLWREFCDFLEKSNDFKESDVIKYFEEVIFKKMAMSSAR